MWKMESARVKRVRCALFFSVQTPSVSTRGVECGRGGLFVGGDYDWLGAENPTKLDFGPESSKCQLDFGLALA